MKTLTLDQAGELVEEEAEDVIDPCFVCGFATDPNSRVQTGNPNAPTLFHRSCRSASKYLDQQAEKNDKKASKQAGETVTTSRDQPGPQRQRHRDMSSLSPSPGFGDPPQHAFQRMSECSSKPRWLSEPIPPTVFPFGAWPKD